MIPAPLWNDLVFTGGIVRRTHRFVNQPAPFAPAVDQQVTASDLVRHFGVWQEHAMRAPVYILHRGRPRLVLVSFDIMDALCGARRDGTADADRATTVADRIDDAVVLFDRDGRVRHLNPAARKRFPVGLHEGARATQMSRVSGGFIAAAIARVASGGDPEMIDLVLDDHDDRRLTARIESLPDGVLVHARDATATEQLRDREAEVRALATVAEASGVTAIARINPRGFLQQPSDALARMTGASIEQLASARFLTLLAVGDRPRIGEAIERVMIRGTSVSEPAALLATGDTPRPVTLSIAAVRSGARIDEAIVLIVLAA